MGAIATRNEIELLRFGGIERRQEGCFARHGNRRGRQSRTRIGVVWGIALQIDLAQIAVEALAQPVDDGRIGLQTHAQPEPVQEDAGDSGTLERHASFLFHDRRHDQRFVGRTVGKSRGPCIPGGHEFVLLPLISAAQHTEIGRVRGIEIGVGKQQALDVVFLGANRLQDCCFAHVRALVLQQRLDGKRGTHIAPVPAFDELHHGLRHFTPLDLGIQLQRSQRSVERIHAHLEHSPLVQHASEQPEYLRVADHAFAFQHRAQTT